MVRRGLINGKEGVPDFVTLCGGFLSFRFSFHILEFLFPRHSGALFAQYSTEDGIKSIAITTLRLRYHGSCTLATTE